MAAWGVISGGLGNPKRAEAGSAWGPRPTSPRGSSTILANACFDFTRRIAELVEIPRADDHFGLGWDFLVKRYIHLASVALLLRARIVLKLDERASIVSHDIPLTSLTNESFMFCANNGDEWA